MKSNIQLNSFAIEMRKKLKEDSESPIDILALINNLKNSTLVFYPMSDRISGMCIKEGQSNVIGINSNMSYGRQRFTVAHELYHLFYEEELKTVICQKDIYGQKPDSEKEADIFASYLLAPYDSLRSYIKENKLLENKEYILKDIIDMQQFYQFSHQAMIYRLMYDGYIDSKQYNSLKMSVSKNAIRLGYDDKLYKPSDKDKKYFSIGEYIQKVEVLKEKELISSGKYDELLLDAFRSDIVYNLGSEDIELND